MRFTTMKALISNGWIYFLGLLVLLGSASAALAGKHGPGNVSPLAEIEVLDPNADPLGNPAVELHPDDSGQLKVDIPKAIIVHKMYYNGSRSFQAQSLPGGPAIVVVSHPKSGERCYINLQMFPGAPKVTYTKHCIDYDFGKQGIRIHFGMFGGQKVVYRNGYTWPQHIANATSAICHETTDLSESAGVNEHAGYVAKGASNALKASARGVYQVSKVVTTPISQIVARTPLGSVFCPTPEATAEHERNHSLKHLDRKSVEAEATIRTSR